MDQFLSAMKVLNQHGVWGIANTMILFLSAILGFGIVFWAKRRVKHLNFHTSFHRGKTSDAYPLIVNIEIRNYAGRSVVISSPYFKYDKLKPDPNARGDSSSGEYEVKFPNAKQPILTEVEYLIRHKESVTTWIPLDRYHSNDEVETILKNRQVGTFCCTCTWLEDRPRVHKLKQKI
jgi:hypothetical protein